MYMTTYTWTGNTDNTWHTSNNWDIFDVPNYNDSHVLFDNIATYTYVDNDDFTTINKIEFTNNNTDSVFVNRYLLTFDGTSPKIIKNGSNVDAISSTFELLADLEINISSGCTLVIGGAINEDHDIYLTGGGTLILTSDNYFRDIYIDTGCTLLIGNHDWTGTAGYGDIYNNGTIHVTTIGTTSLPNTIYGTGTIDFDP